MSNDNLAKYIARRQQGIKSNHLFGRIPVEEKEKLINGVNLERVLRFIEKTIPEHLFGYVDAIYIGSFPALEEREINAAYSDGAIYLTNLQSSEEDMLDDLIHELGHSVEDMYGLQIYSDGEIEDEFLTKRTYLEKFLEYEGFEIPEGFLSAEFSKDIDDFLFRDVGYGILGGLIAGLYPTPYSVTSASEYWAVSFEEFFLGSKASVEAISPHVYQKLNVVVYEDDDYED